MNFPAAASNFFLGRTGENSRSFWNFLDRAILAYHIERLEYS